MVLRHDIHASGLEDGRAIIDDLDGKLGSRARLLGRQRRRNDQGVAERRRQRTQQLLEAGGLSRSHDRNSWGVVVVGHPSRKGPRTRPNANRSRSATEGVSEDLFEQLRVRWFDPVLIESRSQGTVPIL